ncbi:hypothetical protein HW555_008081 [Spodoptera exigua]|uniref:Uncharacterized protein n=1 Tax=Spodoptera exigua TaxID=7107 RepID=A0A835L3S9_SPOEX|nr:hypothetical protein HW555_008081 [Spodoptera exigua]
MGYNRNSPGSRCLNTCIFFANIMKIKLVKTVISMLEEKHSTQNIYEKPEATALGELLGWLRESPHLVSLCLLLGEDNIPPSLPVALMSGLYGSCRSASDRTRFLAVIRSLIKHQMAPSNFSVLGKCALSSLYAVYRDGHTPARQFLVAVLQNPVMAVLHEDEFFLDIDPDKAMERFSPADRTKKFGQPNSQEYAAKVARYRKWTIQSLYNLTTKFIVALREHWPNFPSTIAWIVQQIVHLLKQHSRTSEREVHAICTDLIMNHFICPAIVNPEAHGVVEVPVSYIARFNLIQIAQIIQMLCLAKFQEVDAKVRDVYLKFERSCVWTLIDNVTSEAWSCAPTPAQPHAHAETPRVATDAYLHTTVALFTPHDAQLLITFLRRISSKLNNNTPSVTSDEQPSGSAVAEAAALSFVVFLKFISPSHSSETSSESSSNGEACASRLAALLQTSEPNYRSRLHDLLKKMPDLSKYRPTSPPESKDPSPVENGHSSKRSILAKVQRPRLPRSASSNSSLASASEDKPVNGNCKEDGSQEHVEVLVIKLANVEEQDYIGLVPESKVLECYYGGSEAGDADENGSALAVAGPGAPVQKRTRFSVSHDEVSLGNTSDNLEAVSEAASNHSVTSSLELETEDQNDNLSDMVSANVSGRGSPNISGRETPSSQVTEGPPAQPALHHSHAKLLKQTRNDIEDKFCKFEIKLQNFTKWFVFNAEAPGRRRNDQHNVRHVEHGRQSSCNQNAPDASETASESAWSMDVLASDSDRNTEVDTDDCVSVAARSDTSWPRRPSTHDDAPCRTYCQQVHHPTRYLTATAALSRGGELDLPHPPPSHHQYNIENRKSILVNGYPVMTCYATSAPESPSTSAPVALPGDLFDYVPPNNGPQTESTLDANSQSDATSQWVDDSFPAPHHSPERPYPSTSKYDLPSTSKPYPENDMMDQSLNSSESSFNAMYGGRFDSGIDAERAESESRSAITDLMTRMSSATISTSANLVNNITSRIVKSEIRTSIVSISSSKIEKKREGTSNMSLSTLSVNSAETSASDKSSSQDVNSDIVTERRVSPPPIKNVSTGAIPKSISFDATAEKSQRRRIGEDGLVGNLDELKNNVKRSGGNLLHKIKMFRQKGRSHTHHNGEDHNVKLAEEEARSDDGSRPELAAGESSEEILAKYRRKCSTESTGSKHKRSQRRISDVPDAEMDRSEGVVDLNDPEVFNSMKRKLRIVLSNPDLHCVEFVPNSGRYDDGMMYGRRQIEQTRAEWWWCGRAAGAARALDLLDRGAALRRLARRLHAHPLPHGGELMDEKATRLTASIKAITAEVKADPSWEGASPTLVESVELTVERAAFARLYLHVLFPNGDGDIARDHEKSVLSRVLSEHIRRVSSVTSARSLGVPAAHRWAAPYPRAQRHLRHLAVYRTPRDKLSCIMRCVTSIMAVLGLTEGSTPSADDLTPVLVYVILKVNPPSLLSTIELVNALGGSALQGEALYWWTQFCAAVAYIKTMDYPRPDNNDT